MNSFGGQLVWLFVLLFAVSLVHSCVYNSECGRNSRCQKGRCVVEECRATIDCIGKGLYFECKDSRCVTSKHKICRTDADCKKNVLNKRCVSNRCA